MNVLYVVMIIYTFKGDEPTICVYCNVELVEMVKEVEKVEEVRYSNNAFGNDWNNEN